MKEMAFCGK